MSSTNANLKLVVGAISGLVTIVIGLAAVVYDDKFTGAGVIMAGIGITTNAVR